MLFHDRAKIEGQARITREGYLVADAYVALANNIQNYTAAELGLTDRAPTDTIRLFRPESEVFATDSVATASRLPITLKHPTGMVDAKNWRELAKGETGEEIMRDGDRMRVPLRVTDAGAVNAVATDHDEFSLGYTAEIKLEAGVHDGQAYDASLSTIRYNHLAAVPKARGGPTLRLVDERTPINDGESIVKKLIIDGLQVDLSDASAVETAIGKIQGQLADANGKVAGFETQVATLTTQLGDATAKVATLEQAVKDAALTPAQLRDAAKNFAATVEIAKKLVPTITIGDDMDEAAIRKAVVTAKLGDKAASFNDSQIETAFATSVALLGDAQPDPLRQTIIGSPISIGDAASVEGAARQRMIDRLTGKKPVSA